MSGRVALGPKQGGLRLTFGSLLEPEAAPLAAALFFFLRPERVSGLGSYLRAAGRDEGEVQ